MYYDYIYLDPRKEGQFTYQTLGFLFEPFYVGKGKGNRDRRHLTLAKKETSHMANRIKAIKTVVSEPYIIHIEEHLSEEAALEKEVRLAKKMAGI